MKMIRLVFFTFFGVIIFASCKKEVSLEGGNVTLAGGTWKFQQSTVQYTGNIDSSFIQSSGATKTLSIVGKSMNGQENFSIRLYATDSFTTGSYKASLSQSEFKYFTSSKTIFQGDYLTGEFTVNIVSLSNNSISGTFSGQVEDSTGNLTQITLGTFISTIDLSNNGGGGAGVSVGTLGNTSGACTPATPSGNFVQGIALTGSNTVQITVNITTPGSYIIATNSVNGVNFFKSGTFLNTGVQNVTLVGAGTPLNAGVQTFTITFGSSNCTFPITFIPGTVPVGEYFPIILNSSWAYGLEGGTAADSLFTQVNSYTTTMGGNLFTAFLTDQIPPSGSADTVYFRKSGNDYNTYADVELYFLFDAPVFGEYTFLKDNAPVGTTFRSPDFSGTVSGFPATGFIQSTILEKAVPATVGSLQFPDVIKVQYEYFYTADPGTPILSEEKWFARGVGLIYDDITGFITYDIGRYN